MKVRVPEEMLKAALKGCDMEDYCFDDRDEIRKALESALVWLAEHPIVPTDEQLEKITSTEPMPMTDWARWLCQEWQRRMFAAPDENEGIADLLLSSTGSAPVDDFSRPTREFYNANVREAHRRGLAQGEGKVRG